MCESLLRQAPNGSLDPGLATVAIPNPITVVFTLRPGVRFWDGHPVTSADVVYSLDRNTNPKLGGLYQAMFGRVASIRATGPAGDDQAEAARLLAGGRAVVDADIIIETATLTSGLLTGAIQGYYVANGGLPTLNQLRTSSTVKVYQGPGWARWWARPRRCVPG